MVGIYWIYALFGGSLLFGQKRMQPEHATKKTKTMDCDYLITPFCFYKAWNTYLKTGFGYVWIQYLIDFGENKIQGSQACRILLGSMVGIYWIYALFGGHYCLGGKGCSQNTPQKRKTTMDCDYLITPFCFYKAWNTYLKIGFGYVWIQYLIDFVEMRFQLISQTHRLTLNPSVLFLEHFGCWLGTFLILFLEPLDFIFANPSVGWLMIFSLHNMWGWTPLISFLHFGGQ